MFRALLFFAFVAFVWFLVTGTIWRALFVLVVALVATLFLLWQRERKV